MSSGVADLVATSDADDDIARISAVLFAGLAAGVTEQPSLPAALGRLAENLCATFPGLDAVADRFSAEWRMLLADLLAAPSAVAETWMWLQREAVVGWLPRGVGWRAKALATIVLRGPLVERFHVADDTRDTLLRQQTGMFLLQWAGAHIIDQFLPEDAPLPSGDGLAADDWAAAATFDDRLEVAGRMPAWQLLEALASCPPGGVVRHNWQPPAEPVGGTDELGETAVMRSCMVSANGWLPPSADVVQRECSSGRLVMHQLVNRLRSPVHLTAWLGAVVAADTLVLTPNLLVGCRHVSVRDGWVVLSKHDLQERTMVAVHELGAQGLHPAHAAAFQFEDDTAAPVKRWAGRNDPCPCGSGSKYKRCCL